METEQISGFSQTTATVSAADSIIAGQNLKRRAITISPPAAGTLFVKFGSPAGNNNGIRIPSGTQPKTFEGRAFTLDIHAYNLNGADSIDVLEVLGP